MTEVTVPKKSNVTVFRIDTPIIPERRHRIEITNPGLAKKVTAKYYWSHSFTSGWFEYASVDVGIEETMTLTPPNNPLYYSKVEIYNDTDFPAYISARML